MIKRSKNATLKKGTFKFNTSKFPKSKGTMKRGGGLKVRVKSPEEKQQNIEEGQKMMELFTRHWNSKKKVCESCGIAIWGENLTLYHHHLLPKSKYKALKYEIDNLILLCWYCHYNTENGNPSEAVKKATEAVKIKFNVT